MCGIAGSLQLRPERLASREVVERMCGVLRHRGPDDDGVLIDGALGMGMRRLSIIDLATGAQPLANEDGSVWTVFNGEIYNYPELRAGLEARGHRFTTTSDTEVIVHLYEDHGVDLVHHLEGMFGLAVWDRARRRLVLARDRLGIKPLYWTVDAGRLLFGSELKALLAAGVSREVDLQAVDDYLALNYVPGPRTIYQGVHKLPPGHLLVCEDGAPVVRRYWTIPYPHEPPPRGPEGAWAEGLC
jgi:asparagine synthase (glutamine-hydrolysing)